MKYRPIKLHFFNALEMAVKHISAMYKLAVVVKYVKGFPIQDDYYSVLGVIFPTNYDATFQVLF